MGQTVSYTIEAHADWSGQTVLNDSECVRSVTENLSSLAENPTLAFYSLNLFSDLPRHFNENQEFRNRDGRAILGNFPQVNQQQFWVMAQWPHFQRRGPHQVVEFNLCLGAPALFLKTHTA